MKFLLGTKQAMTRRFRDDGKVIPVTVITAGPCVVTQVQKDAKTGMTGVEIGFGTKKRLTKPMAGHLKGLQQFRYLRQYRTADEGMERGKALDVSLFSIGDIVKVTGFSKGRGFAGVVKRHGFGGSPATHGHKDQLRMPGSIGATNAQRVFPGTRMAGQMGNERVTVRNLEVVSVHPETHELVLKGAVPGARNALLLIEGTRDAKT